MGGDGAQNVWKDGHKQNQIMKTGNICRYTQCPNISQKIPYELMKPWPHSKVKIRNQKVMKLPPTWVSI